jgi:hypothetical protein
LSHQTFIVSLQAVVHANGGAREDIVEVLPGIGGFVLTAMSASALNAA